MRSNSLRLFVLFLLVSATAFAGSVTLTFEGATNPAYYNQGPPPSQGGHNYGVVFSPNTLFFNTSFYNNPANSMFIDPTDANCALAVGGVCMQTSGNWSNNTVMAQFPHGPNLPVIMNVFGGLTNALSFTSSGADVPTTVDIFSDLYGHGTLLAQFNLPVLDPWSYDTEFDALHGGNFVIDFNGVGHSVVFYGGTQPATVDFDNVSFDTPGVPEPGSLLLLASGALGFSGILRRKFGR